MFESIDQSFLLSNDHVAILGNGPCFRESQINIILLLKKTYILIISPIHKSPRHTHLLLLKHGAYPQITTMYSNHSNISPCWFFIPSISSYLLEKFQFWSAIKSSMFQTNIDEPRRHIVGYKLSISPLVPQVVGYIPLFAYYISTRLPDEGGHYVCWFINQ